MVLDAELAEAEADDAEEMLGREEEPVAEAEAVEPEAVGAAEAEPPPRTNCGL